MTHQENQALRDVGVTPQTVARSKKAIKGFTVVTSNSGTTTASIPLPGTAKYLLGIKTVNSTTANAVKNTFDAVLNNEKILDQVNLGFTETTYGGNGNNEGYLECFRVLTGKDVLNVNVTANASGGDTIYFIVYYAL